MRLGPICDEEHDGGGVEEGAAEAMVASKSFASRRLRLIQAKKRSTTQRRRLDGEADLIGAFAHDLDGDHGGRGDLLAA